MGRWKPANSDPKELDFSKVLEKLSRYCAYQDRCWFEVENKLNEFVLTEKEREAITRYLEEEKFVDETRFTEFYVKGKFNLKGWGKLKIRAHLQQKQISPNLIEQELTRLDQHIYLQKLNELANKKMANLEKEEPLKAKQKLIRFLASRGFEYDLINQVIDH